MVQDVFALHSIGGKKTLEYPYSVDEYQRYVFGDDALAYRFGTELAKAFVVGRGASSPDDIAVAVLSDGVPTATHALRDHLVAYLNRHLVAANARPAVKLELYRIRADGQNDSQTIRHGHVIDYHIDSVRLGDRPLFILGDFQLSHDYEIAITTALQRRGIKSTVSFIYLIALNGSISGADVSPFLSSVSKPTTATISSLAQSSAFRMNESFVHFVVASEHAEFSRLIRRQDDGFVRLLLEYAIIKGYYKEKMYQDNFKFLMWEAETREQIA